MIKTGLAITMVATVTMFHQMVVGKMGETPAGGGGEFSPTVSLIDAAGQNAAPSATTITPGSTFNVNAGDVLAVWAGSAQDPSFGSTIAASPSIGTWTEVQDVHDGSNAYQNSCYYVVASSTEATVTITVTFGTSSAFRYCAATQFRTDDGTFALDQDSCNAVSCGDQASASTGRTAQNVTTTVADSLLLGVGIDWDGGFSHTGANSYALVSALESADTPFAGWKQVSSTGTHPSGNFVTTSSDEYYTFFLTFGISE